MAAGKMPGHKIKTLPTQCAAAYRMGYQVKQCETEGNTKQQHDFFF